MLSNLQDTLGLGSLFTMALSLFSGKQQQLLQHHPVVYEPVQPPSYPLAVRNPYLSTWMPSDQVSTLPYGESQFWTGQNLTWSIMARVDGNTYSLMGVNTPDEDGILPATVRNAEYTATHSLFTLSAGGLVFKLDFFSPISPWNYLRQSLPFSYLTISVAGAWSNNIQVFSSIDGRWTGRSSDAVANFQQANSTAIYSLTVESAFEYSEESDMATWGQAILASRPTVSSTLSYSSGKQAHVHSQFVQNGKLAGNDSPWLSGGIVALAHDLGTVTGQQTVNFAVGYEREHAISYLDRAYTGYYRGWYPQVSQALSHFLDDYQDALVESRDLDLAIVAQAKAAAGQKYTDIVTLSARQAYGGIDVTIPDDTRDTNDVLAFVKELSSNGNLNTVDVIMPAFPIYYIIDPDYIRLLLEPMMRYLSAGRWYRPYTIHDMGAHYPNATGHDDQKAEPMPIEECGNLMVLALAYVQATGDTNWTTRYEDVLRPYADYLAENSIDIVEQLSSNDAAGALANETNLAIKAAVGLKAFGQLTGFTSYSDIGGQHADLFFNQGLGTDVEKTHFVLQYPDDPDDPDDPDNPDNPASWKTPYNLYPDVLFDLNTFPKTAHEMDSTFFRSVRAEYGVALDNRQDWAKSDWNMWLAGTFDTDTRDQFVDDLWAYMTNGKHNWPFSDRYISTSAQGNDAGVPVLCRARPTVGGHFALMALQGPKSLQHAVLKSGLKHHKEEHFSKYKGEEL